MSSRDCLNFLDQTLRLRLSPKWADVRGVLATRGVDAQKVVLFSCDHAGGDNMDLWLALPDGSIVNCVLCEEASSRCYASVVAWRTVNPESDEEMLLASRAASDPVLTQAFEQALKGFHEFCELMVP